MMSTYCVLFCTRIYSGMKSLHFPVLSYFDGPRSEAVMHFESFVRPQATLHPHPEFLFSGFCLILPLSRHEGRILSYILGESFSWHGTMQADLRIEARISCFTAPGVERFL